MLISVGGTSHTFWNNMKLTQNLVDRTQALLSDFNDLLDHNPEVNGELRAKLSKAELCLFKIASLMQESVDKQK